MPTDFTPKKNTTRTNSVKDKIDLDIRTSKNLIGEIINLSQILNSEYWHRVKKGKSVEGLYEYISQLDVMSCIEIDKAKKESLVDSEKELRLIRESEFISYGEISRDKKKRMAMCRPYFFKFVGEGKNYKFKKMETPMDYLEQIIDKEIPRSDEISEDVSFLSLLALNGYDEKSNRRQIQNIFNKVEKLNNEINGVWASSMPYEEKIKYTMFKKEVVCEQIRKLKITDETLINIIYRIDKDYKNKFGEIKKFGLLMLNILFQYNKEQFLNLFISAQENVSVLKEIEESENKLKIYQKSYEKVTF